MLLYGHDYLERAIATHAFVPYVVGRRQVSDLRGRSRESAAVLERTPLAE
jgi:hypothetical protein